MTAVKENVVPLQTQTRNNDGAIAQLVEQRTENPCVPGSIPGGTTKPSNFKITWFFYFIIYILVTQIYSFKKLSIKRIVVTIFNFLISTNSIGKFYVSRHSMSSGCMRLPYSQLKRKFQFIAVR